MQIITLLNKSKNSFYLSQYIRDGLVAFAFRRDLQLYWQISCMMTLSSLMLAHGWLRCKTQLATCNRTVKLPSLPAFCFCQWWNMLWCLVLSVADFKKNFWQKLHLQTFFFIAVGWLSSLKLFSSLSTSWRKVL